MSSLKIILFKGKTYADETHPIMLQYYDNNGKIKRKVIHRCLVKDWDSKTTRVKPRASNSGAINNFISETFAEAEKELFDIRKGAATGISFFSATSNITVKQALENEMERLKAVLKPTPYSQLESYIKQMGNMAEIPVAHANINWFNNIMDTFKKSGNSAATLEKKVKHIRRVLAKQPGAGLSNEVKAIRITVPKPVKQKLTATELSLIENAELDGDSNKAIARDIFMLQIYLRGVRIGDILQATNEQFADGRFSYASEKTGKGMDIKLVPKGIEIIDRYKGKYQRLFPFFDWEYDAKISRFDNERLRLKHKETCTSLVNNSLKKLAKDLSINKPLSSHIARHTFARMAIDKINNPMITMELLGHSSLAVHQMYLNDIRKDDVLDAAADNIFS